MPESVREGDFAAWRAWAESLERWRMPYGPLCVVAPHPDDETLGAGGLMFRCRRRGRRVSVVSVTDGEASHPGVAQLAAIRRRELLRALRILGGPALRPRRLRLPDGRVRRGRSRLRKALQALDREVVLIAPYERDGHPDHEAVGEVCAEVAIERGMPLARYLIWGWSHLAPAVLRELPCRRVDLDADARRAKTAALACFASQLGAGRGPPIVPPAVLAYFESPYELFLT